MNFCILIPTINRADLLMEALPVYKEVYPNVKVYILDNGHQKIPISSKNFEIITPRTRI